MTRWNICNCHSSNNFRFLGRDAPTKTMEFYKCLDCFPEEMSVEIPPQVLSSAEIFDIVNRFSDIVDGPEQGVRTMDEWRQECKDLYRILQLKGYKPSGQWCSNL